MWNIFSKKIKNSKSERSNTGYKGITKVSSGKFEAYICKRMIKKNNKKPVKITISHSDTLKEAIEAREEFIDNLY